MTAKLFPYPWTCLVGVAFLGSLLWSVTFCDGISDIVALLFFACFVASMVASAVLVATRRSKHASYRFLINVIFCLLLYPTILFGGSFRDRLFLKRLPRFQEATNFLIKDEMAKRGSDVFSTVVSIPPQYSDLKMLDRVIISSARQNITVRFAMRDSNALSHRGYMYRSDDDPAALSKEYPETGYTRVAPYWFFFSD